MKQLEKTIDEAIEFWSRKMKTEITSQIDEMLKSWGKE
jgi:hypothetical protein